MKPVIASHAFALPSGSTQDLTTLVQVPSSPGYGLPQAEAAVNETITGAVVVGDDLQMTRRNGGTFIAGNVRGAPGEDSTVPGPPGPVSTVPGPPGADSTVPGPPGPQGDPGPSGVSNTDQFYQVSETAGRTLSVWDYLNSRYQLIYGDTGWREIALSAGWTGRVFIRRVGTKVSLLFNAVQSPTEMNLIAVVLAPGYRSGAPTGISERFLLHNTSSAARRGYASFDGVSISNLVANEALYGSAEMFTVDPWPTALPGVAA